MRACMYVIVETWAQVICLKLYTQAQGLKVQVQVDIILAVSHAHVTTNIFHFSDSPELHECCVSVFSYMEPCEF